MSTAPQALSAAYQQCLNEALTQSPLMIKRWFTQLAQTLYERATAPLAVPEKQLMYQAWVALTNNQAAIENGFAMALTNAIAESAKAGTFEQNHKTARSLSSLHFDELELMDDTQLQAALNVARMQEVILLASSAGLAAFSARMSTVQGFETVKADRNPLRPEIFFQALMNLLHDLPVEAAALSRWQVFGGQLMGNEVQALYVQLSKLLAEQGIEPAAYVVISSQEEVHRQTAGSEITRAELPAQSAQLAQLASEPQLDADRSVGVNQEPLLTLDHLHSLMVGDFDDSLVADAEASMAASVFGSLESGYREPSHTLPAAGDAAAERGKSGTASAAEKKPTLVPPQPVAQIRERLKTEAKSMGQSLVIEVVGQMIEQLVADARLLAPVRQVIANAEPAFLRLGLTDPRFFSDKSHPARRLLDAITASSLAYASEDAPGFASFMQNLRQVAGFLTAEHASDAPHFTALLQDFESRQARQNLETSETQSRAVQALLQAEQRNLLAEKIASDIRMRSDFVAVTSDGDGSISAFLTGPWAQVMAQERLRGELGGIGSTKAVFGLTLGDVLWSLNVAQAARHRKRLVKIIPGMLSSVREGLLSIDFPLEQSKAFFDELMRVHHLALKPQPSAAVVLAPKPRTRADLEKEFDAADSDWDASRSARLWLAPTEAQQSGFMDYAADERKPEIGSRAVQPQGDRTETSDSSNSLNMARISKAGETARRPSLDGVDLKLGAWVELLAGSKWLRAQLTWISPHNTLFMFSSDGGRSHSMTAQIFQQLVVQQRIKFISQQGVLDGALDGVARTAMRNSVTVSGNL